jgi:hypothetical protein
MGDRASYYDAKAIRDGLRAHDSLTRAKKITKKYRVRVEECLTGSGKLIISTFDRAQSITV